MMKTKLKRLLDREKLLSNMLKVDCCDICFDKLLNYETETVSDPEITIQMGFRKFGLCRKHAEELRNELSDFLEER